MKLSPTYFASVISAPTKKKDDVLESPEWDVNCSFGQRSNMWDEEMMSSLFV
jgi:hypothetical protein